METDEKDKLRGFVLTVLDYVSLPVPDSSIDPIRKTNDLRSLRTAATDMVEMCQELNAEQIGELDKLLLEKGYPSLTEMSDRSLQRLKNILSRNRIESNDDWRFVESYIADVDSQALVGEDRESANRLLAEYESSIRA